jgi:tetratricopeptide (TPR) repeat protein
MAALESAALRVRRYDLGSVPYQALLHDYLRGRLSLDYTKAVDMAAADDIIRAADGRFAYVSFLADRRETGEVSAQQVAALAKGDGLYRLWLSHLDREYGRKQAEAIRQVLAVLAAAEEAHAFVFGPGRKLDPATGGALTPLPEQFEGLEIGLLARLLDLDRPHAATYDRIDPGLLFTLQTLQGVLWVSRAGAGETRFRLALKEFLPAAKADQVVGPMLQLMQARIAARALDAADRMVATNAWGGPDWEVVWPLAPLLEALVHLSGSQPLAAKWQTNPVEPLLVRYAIAVEERGFGPARIPFLTMLAALRVPASVRPSRTLSFLDRDYVATLVLNRGKAKAEGGYLAAALADTDAAIRLRQAVRDEMGKAWPPELQDHLAVAFLDRGHIRLQGGNVADATADYGEVIRIREDIRKAKGEHWTVSMRQGLATALMSRGAARKQGGDLTGATDDYGAAIGIMNTVRDMADNAWTVAMQSALAGCHRNRGDLKGDGGDFLGAVDDHTAAIRILEGIRDARPAEWTNLLQNDLAGARRHRGIARAGSGDSAGAIEDMDEAIRISEAIRNSMSTYWPLPFQSELAGAYQDRGAAKWGGGDVAGAIFDNDTAINLMQSIRNTMAKSWPIPYQHDLARTLHNRGIMKRDSGDRDAAIRDYDEAIDLMAGIHDAVGEEAWRGFPAWAEALRMILANRQAAIDGAAALAKSAAVGFGFVARVKKWLGLERNLDV